MADRRGISIHLLVGSLGHNGEVLWSQSFEMAVPADAGLPAGVKILQSKLSWEEQADLPVKQGGPDAGSD